MANEGKLEGKTIAATYKSLLKLANDSDGGGVAANTNIVSDSLKAIEDGYGNISALAIANDKATLTLGTGSGDDFVVTNSSGAAILTAEGDNSKVGIGTSAPAKRLDILDTSTDQIRLSQAADNHYSLRVDTDGDLNFNDKDGTTIVCFTDAGNVGIVATSPKGNLQIIDASSSAYLQLQGASGAYGSNINFWADAGEDATDGYSIGVADTGVFRFRKSTGNAASSSGLGTWGTTVMTLDNNGYVGIGDTAPEGSGLTINQGSSDDLILSFKSSDIAHGMTDLAETDTYARFKKIDGATGGLIIGSFRESTGTTAMTMNSYIATGENATRSTSGHAPFEVRVGKTDSATVQALAADKNMVVFKNQSTARFIFDSDGDLHSDSSNTTFSDSRLKSNVEDIPYGLAQILQLQPKRFDKESGGFDDNGNIVLEGNKRKMIGFMAQDVKAIIPEMVKDVDTTKSFYSMEYGKLVSVLVKAVQELSAKVTALESA